MNIKLHNKYEVITGGQTYTFYNTITHKIYERILDNFSPYATYFAFGTGTGSVYYDESKMRHFTQSYPSTLEEIQCDPSKGEMYVKRVISFGEDDAIGLTFSEIGITYTSQNNPDICNHVVVKDKDDIMLTITKKQGQTMVIRVTIYLSFTQQSLGYLTAGDNNLIRAILGERNCECTFKASRGYNLQPNTCIPRNVPRDAQYFDCDFSVGYKDDGKPYLQLDFDLLSGETAEIVLFMGGSPIARLNMLDHRETVERTLHTTSQSNNTIDVGEWVKEVTNLARNSVILDEPFVTKRYASDFTDFVKDPFDAPLAAANARWVSKDLDKFAFISGNAVHLYINKDFQFKKVACNIDTTDLKDIIMFEDYVFAVYSQSPYLKVYNLQNNALVQLQTDFTNYTYAYGWQELKIIKTTSGGFLIGLLNTPTRIPIILDAEVSNGVFTITAQQTTQCTSAKYMYDIYKSNFCGSAIAFVTENYLNQAENYRIENFYDDGTTNVGDSTFAYYMCNGTVSLEGKSRAAVAKRTQSPYIWLFYYPVMFRYSISLTEGVENWISGDLMYIIQGYPEGEERYKIYTLTNYNNPQEFVAGFPSQINLSSVVDFEFLKDTLLIFTATQVYALNLKLTSMVVENLADKDPSYSVVYNKYQLSGQDESEGVAGKFTMEFTI